MKTLLFLAFLLASCLPGFARDITFAWDPNPSSEGVTAYVLEWSQDGGTTWTQNTPTTGTEQKILNLPNAPLLVRVFARAGTVDGPVSDPITVEPTAPGKVTGLKTTVTVTVTVETPDK